MSESLLDGGAVAESLDIDGAAADGDPVGETAHGSSGFHLTNTPPTAPVAAADWDVLQPAVNLGTYNGGYMSQGFGNTIYFNAESGGAITSEYYNISSGTFEVYDDLFADFYRAVAVQLGYAYAICNNKVLNITIDPSVSTDYKEACDDING